MHVLNIEKDRGFVIFVHISDILSTSWIEKLLLAFQIVLCTNVLQNQYELTY